MPSTHLSLSVPNERSAAEPARLAVMAFLAPWHFSERLAYRVELVLEEVLVNAMAYAFPAGSPDVIELQVEVHPDAVVLHFQDEGVPFDPESVPEPPMPTRLADASPGGRGLMLVRKVARQLAYHRSNGRNHLRIEVASA
jgi:serine/threonine-protein kinase RsbW